MSEKEEPEPTLADKIHAAMPYEAFRSDSDLTPPSQRMRRIPNRAERRKRRKK